MADSEDGDTFSVDIDELERGGVRIRDMSDNASRIRGNVRNVLSKYGNNLGGNGDIGKSFEKNYYPAALAGEQFLDSLADLVDIHGDKTIKLGGFFDGVDQTSSNEANGNGTGHRH